MIGLREMIVPEITAYLIIFQCLRKIPPENITFSLSHHTIDYEFYRHVPTHTFIRSRRKILKQGHRWLN